MAEVITEDRFAIQDEHSVTVALAMLRRRLLEFEISEMLVAKLLTISSELAGNVLKYAVKGTLHLRQVRRAERRGLEITVEDEGPGIADVDLALQDHFSSQGTLGLGLPGVKRMVDDFELTSKVGEGTSVRAVVWL